jgi:2-aminoadipate transaminase
MQSDSFSKKVLPGMRLGWMAGSTTVINALGSVRQDLGVSQYFSRVMAEFLAEGMLDRHLVKVNALYRTRRDAAVNALRHHCGDRIQFNVPDGSFYLWIELPRDLDLVRLRAVLAEEGAFFRTGDPFLAQSSPTRFLRMCFSYASEGEINGGVRALAKAIDAASQPVAGKLG